MKIEEEYNLLLKSGMFWEFFPELTGVWEKDKEEFKKIHDENEKRRANRSNTGNRQKNNGSSEIKR